MKCLECSVGHQCLVQVCEGRRCLKIWCQTLVLCRRNITRGSAAVPLLRSIYTWLSLRKQDQLHFSCWCFVPSMSGEENLAAHPLLCLCNCSFQHAGSLVPPAAFPVSPLAAVSAQRSICHGHTTPSAAGTQQDRGILLALPQPFEMQHRENLPDLLQKCIANLFLFSFVQVELFFQFCEDFNPPFSQPNCPSQSYCGTLCQKPSGKPSLVTARGIF